MQPLLERGEPYQAEFRIVRPSGEVRWCASTATASLDGAGKVVRISGVTIDITDRKGAEERQALLAREVDHRAKNAMAIVQSIIRLTKADNVGDYANVIEGRIKALSRAHAILSDSRWQGADLAKLVDEELAPYRSGGDDRISVSGPHVVLDPTTAQTLALALHELATNGAEVWRAVARLGQARHQVAGTAGGDPDRLARERWAADAGAAQDRVRHPDHRLEHRTPAWRQRPSSTGVARVSPAHCRCRVSSVPRRTAPATLRWRASPRRRR